MEDRERMKVIRHELVQIRVRPYFRCKLERLPFGCAYFEGADGQHFVVQSHVVRGHSVGAAEVARAVRAVFWRELLFLGRFPQISAVTGDEESRLEQVHVIPK